MDANYSVVGPLLHPSRDGGSHLLLAHSPDGRRFVVKKIPCGRNTPQRQAALRVGEIMRRVKDIAGFVDAVETESHVALVTEYAAMGSLKDEIQRRRILLQPQKEEEKLVQQQQQQRLSRRHVACNRDEGVAADENMKAPFFTEEEVVKLLIQLLYIMRQLYAHGIIHGRVTSDHILLFDDWFEKMRLCGFGHASSYRGDEGSKENQLLQQQELFNRIYSPGNSSRSSLPAFISSPHGHRLGCDSISHKAKHDVWLIGAVAYEMCTLGSRVSLQSNIKTEALTTGLYSPCFCNLLLSMLTKDTVSRPTCAQLEYMLRHHRPCGFSDNRRPLTSPLVRDVSAPCVGLYPLTESQSSGESTQNGTPISSLRTEQRVICNKSCTLFHVSTGVQPSPRYHCSDKDVMKKQQRIPFSSLELEDTKSGVIGVEPLRIISAEADNHTVKISDCNVTNNSCNNDQLSVKGHLMGECSTVLHNKCGSSAKQICRDAESRSPITFMFPECNTETNFSHSEKDTRQLGTHKGKGDAQEEITVNAFSTPINKRNSTGGISTTGMLNNTTTTTTPTTRTSARNSLSHQSLSVGHAERTLRPLSAFMSVGKEICKSPPPQRRASKLFSCNEKCKSAKEGAVTDLRTGANMSAASPLSRDSGSHTITSISGFTSLCNPSSDESATTEAIVAHKKLTPNTLYNPSTPRAVDLATPLTSTEFRDGASEYSLCNSFVVLHRSPNTRGELIHRRHLPHHGVAKRNRGGLCCTQ